jgi:hypothetical protein
MNLLMIYKALLTIAPYVRPAMHYAQSILPEKGQGAVRLVIAKAHLGQIFADLQIAEAKFEDVWPKLEADIARAVPILQGLGILKNTDVLDATLKTVDVVASDVKQLATAAGAKP